MVVAAVLVCLVGGGVRVGDGIDAVSRLVSSWGHTVEWLLAPKEMEDMERAERFKVSVQGSLPPMAACRWPSVCIFEFGRGSGGSITSRRGDGRCCLVLQIRAFLEIVQGRPTVVGVPLTPNWRSSSPTDPKFMEIEQWSIIQAFGLADLGTGGFFTMKHRVKDITPSLQQLWGHVDAHTLAHIYSESVDALYHHWLSFQQVRTAVAAVV